MANDAVTGQYYPPGNGISPSVPTAMQTAAASLRGDTVVSYADVAARNAAISDVGSSLTSDQKKGVVCHVQSGTSRGWWGFDGTSWYRFPMKGLTFNFGTAQGTCDSNGIMEVLHGLPSAPVSVQVTMEGDNGQIRYLNPVVVLIDSTRFLIKFWYNNPASGTLQLNSNGYTSFHWRAEL